MRQRVTSGLAPLQRSFQAFTTAQKTIAILGAIALLIGGVMIFRWASTPAYAPLFTNVAAADASAIVEQLEADGTPYQLADGGSTILVPRPDVYDARIRLSGEGLPSQGSDGYALLDNQDLSTSQFQEQTSFKRAMEGELAKTIKAIDGVDTAVVHLALPQEEIFADEQEQTTASVLVATRAGNTLEPGQVQAVVHLVASSVEGLDPDQVTVADSTGRVLSASGDGFDSLADTRSQQVTAFEQRMSGSVQGMLDRVLGSGNTAVQVTADLSFDKAVTNTTRYFSDPETLPLSDTTLTESYTAPNAPAGGGVVGPDGQLDPNAGGNGEAGENTRYRKEQTTSDNAVGQTVEEREAAPGSVDSLHVGVVLDTQSLGGVDPEEVQGLISSALGIDRKRGDTVEVSVMPFDRSAEEAAAEALAAAKAAEEKAAQMSMLKTAGLVLLVVLLALGAWLRSRRREKARRQATSYVVEQLKRQPVEAEPQPALESPALAVVEQTPTFAELPDVNAAARGEIAALVERQPEEVAQLLRGWLVEHGEQ
jgi:flagellar M-ring protein FliF